MSIDPYLKMYRVRGLSQQFDTYVFATTLADAALAFRSKNGNREAEIVERIGFVHDIIGVERLAEEVKT